MKGWKEKGDQGERGKGVEGEGGGGRRGWREKGVEGEGGGGRRQTCQVTLLGSVSHTKSHTHAPTVLFSHTFPKMDY